MIPRAVDALFKDLAQRERKAALAAAAPPGSGAGSGGASPSGGSGSGSGAETSAYFRFSVHCSMLQIYNEQLNDLLSASALYGEGDALKIREVRSVAATLLRSI